MFIETKKRSTAGFTLVEAIASIALLVTAITGPMVLSAQSLRVSRDARFQLEATQLAEEGVEIVHSIRDNNSADDAAMPPVDWMNNILSECSGTCIADVTDQAISATNPWKSTALKACTAPCTASAPLYKNTTSGLYRQRFNGLNPPGTWAKTDFTRLITVTQIVAGRQVRVQSTVTYKSYSGAIRTMTVTEDLYNWFPNIH